MATLTREAIVAAAQLVRRRWPASAALELLELRPAELRLVLELVLRLDARPLDPETLLPIVGEPLEPPPKGKPLGGRGTAPRDVGRAEAAKIARRLPDAPPASPERRPLELADLELDALRGGAS